MLYLDFNKKLSAVKPANKKVVYKAEDISADTVLKATTYDNLVQKVRHNWSLVESNTRLVEVTIVERVAAPKGSAWKTVLGKTFNLHSVVAATNEQFEIESFRIFRPTSYKKWAIELLLEKHKELLVDTSFDLFSWIDDALTIDYKLFAALVSLDLLDEPKKHTASDILAMYADRLVIKDAFDIECEDLDKTNPYAAYLDRRYIPQACGYKSLVDHDGLFVKLS